MAINNGISGKKKIILLVGAILLVALVTLLNKSHNVRATDYCCVNTTSDVFCQAYDNYSTVFDACGGIQSNVTNTLCDAPGSVANNICSTTQGCCCDFSTATPGADYPVSYSTCTLTGRAWYNNQTADCQSVCSNNAPSITSCDPNTPPTLSFQVTAVKGSSNVSLSWDSCGYVATIKKTGTGVSDTFTVPAGTTTYMDSGNSWGTPYTYNITIVYPTKTLSEKLSITTGDAACKGVYNDGGVCGTKAPNVGDVITCNSNNKVTITQCTGESACVATQTTAYCASSAPCATNSLLGITNETNCEYTSRGDRKNCYYERGTSAFNQCFSCKNVDSCFSYKTENSCGQDFCGAGNCYWDPTTDVGQGGGICKSTTASICQYVQPTTSAADSIYSQLMTPTPNPQETAALFSTSNYTCQVGGGTCGTPKSCANLKTKDACDNSTDTCGINCYYVNNECTRLTTNTNDPTPCAGLSAGSASRTACEQDFYLPDTTCRIQNINVNPLFLITIYDRLSSDTIPKAVSNPFPAYTTQACVLNGNPTTISCDGISSTTDLKSPIFNLIGLNDTFKNLNIQPNKAYTLVMRTTDPYNNTESSWKSRSFTTPSSFTDLTGFHIKLLSPIGGEVLYGKKFTINVTAKNQQISTCSYILNGVKGSFYLSGANTYSSTPVSILDQGSLSITCNPTSSDYKADTLNVPLQIITSPPKVTLSADPQYIFVKTPTNYQTTININSDQAVLCRYSLDSSKPYADMTLMSTTQEYSTTHSVQLSFSKQGEYPVTVECINALGNLSNKEQVIVTANESYTNWVKILSPEKYRTYNQTNVDVNISAIKGAKCTAYDYSSGNNATTPTQIANNWYDFGNMEFGNDANTLQVNCTLNDAGGQHTASDSVTSYYDSSIPNIGISMFNHGPAYSGGYSNELQYTLVFNTTGSNIASASYNITQENDNQTFIAVVQGDTTVPVQNKTGYNYVSYNLKQTLVPGDIYRVTAKIKNAAGSGNIATATYIYDASLACHDNTTDRQETGVDCGGPVCGSTCNVGQGCKVDADCLSNLACDQTIHECVPSACIANNQCGGDCRPCVQQIWLKSPQFGISSKPNPTLVWGSLQNVSCGYYSARARPDAFFQIDAPKVTSKTHIKTSYTLADGQSDTLNVVCFNGTGNFSAKFDISVDSNPPKLNNYDVRPDVLTEKYSMGAGGKNAYWTDISAETDKPTVCKYSTQTGTYSQMQSTLADSQLNESKLNSYSTTHNLWVPFFTEGPYTIHITCLGENGLVSSSVTKKLLIDSSANVTPKIMSPLSYRIYDTKNINITVDALSNIANACIAKADSFDYNKLAKQQGSIYSAAFSIPSDGPHTTAGMCTYTNIAGVSYNSSASSGFQIDTTPPGITKFAIMDPNTKNESITYHENAIGLDIESYDAISGTAYYNYTVDVNGKPQVSRLVPASSNYFEENGLHLKDGDKIQASVIAEDKAGNWMQTGKDSNTLTYQYVVPPNTCTDNKTDGNETGVDCGGNCQACTNNQACIGNADCQPGYYCGSGSVCVPRANQCSNGVLDKGLETGVDCGGTCPACTIAGDKCTSNNDCDASKGLFCDTNAGICKLDINTVCSNNQLDPLFETGVDCGGICAAQLDKTCPQGGSCTSNADCSSPYICSAGTCVSSGYTGTVCKDDGFNNTIIDNATGNSTYCGRGCSSSCPDNTGCQNDQDCSSHTCLNHVCAPTGTYGCTNTGRLQSGQVCGGTCPSECPAGEPCNNNGDCQVGLVCDGIGECSNPSNKPTNSINNTNTLPTGKTARGGWWWKILLMILLLGILGGVGYYAYITYYLPNKKPEYKQETGTTGTQQQTTSETPRNVDISGHPHNAVEPPKAPPLSEEKQKQIDALLRKKRREEKKNEMKTLFSAFDNSELEKAQLQDKEKSEISPDEEQADKEASNEKSNLKKESIKDGMPSFDSKLSDEKEENTPSKPITFKSTKEPELKPVIPVRKKKSYDTFKEILNDGKKTKMEKKNDEKNK